MLAKKIIPSIVFKYHSHIDMARASITLASTASLARLWRRLIAHFDFEGTLILQSVPERPLLSGQQHEEVVILAQREGSPAHCSVAARCTILSTPIRPSVPILLSSSALVPIRLSRSVDASCQCRPSAETRRVEDGTVPSIAESHTPHPLHRWTP